MTNLSAHTDEIEALVSIYGNDWKCENDSGTTWSIEAIPAVTLFVTFTAEYPSDGPPKYDLLAPSLSADQKLKISNEFEAIYKQNFGSPVLFQWIERLKEIVPDEKPRSESHTEHCKPEESIDESPLIDIVHGPLIQDRKSVFQGHTCKVHSQEDVSNFMNTLLKNRKIAQATHNILAYRVKLQNGNVLQDCDDDGETHAGGRLLHLLQIVNALDIAVVVSRWYGGIHLGPDRFRHINNAARQALQEGGFIKSR